MDTSETALTSARLLLPAAERPYQADARLWQGIPSLAWTGKTGYAVFYSGQKTEESGNFAVVMTYVKRTAARLRLINLVLQ